MNLVYHNSLQSTKGDALAINLDVPQWVQERIAWWKDKLEMWEWRLHIRLEMILDDNENCRGLCQPYPDTNQARIQFRADIEDTEEWEITILHELLHVKHSRIDDTIWHIFGPMVNMPNETVESIYKRQNEPYIESMAQCLVRLRRETEETTP